MKTALALLACLAFAGCASLPRATISTGSAVGPRDNGTPAKVSSGSTVTTAVIPTGSTITFTPADSVAPVTATISAPMELRTESRTESAQTGTVDTTVATKRIEVESAADERRPLLWVAIACGVLGVLAFALLKEWPIIGRALLAASALAGVAWKVAEVPWWAFAAVLLFAAIAVAFYKRAEWDADKDGIPDILQRKP